MFCHQCGRELYENARFCYNCGTPVRKAFEQAEIAVQEEHTVADAGAQNSQTETSSDDPGASESQAVTSSDDPGASELQTQTSSDDPGASESQAATSSDDPEASGSQELSPPPAASAVETPADLILKKGKVIATGRELHLNGKHYARKPGKKRFKKKKNAYSIPFDTILGSSMEHRKYGGRIFLSLILLLCFAAGVLFSARYGYDTYNELQTPYRDKELAAQEDIMALIDGSGADDLLQCQSSQAENRADADSLSAKLTELEAQQVQEILTAAYTSNKFDLDTFFNRESFTRAYREYLQDLINAFREDELLDSWLYGYYVTTREYDGNYFLNTDMWIYNGQGENKFSFDLDSASALMSSQYDLDLYEHILYAGRIYITGADFLKEILSLPRYTVDGAVFVKAYGGVPDPAEMSVPGWSRSHYEEFWLYGADYYSIDTPMWLDYGLQAESFEIDWNALVDETAYYTAYRNFMDKIDPNLPCYDIAVYHADNMAYGGMGYSIKGTEASFSDIIASYAETHPEFIDELMEDRTFGKTLTTSVDEEIAEAEAQLEKLEKELLDLQEQEKELALILTNADIHRSNYAFLLADIEQRTQELTYRLLFFGGAALLCVLNALICLCKFFSFLKCPRHLFIVNAQDMEYAFNARRIPLEQIVALQNRLPGQDNDEKNL